MYVFNRREKELGSLFDACSSGKFLVSTKTMLRVAGISGEIDKEEGEEEEEEEALGMTDAAGFIGYFLEQHRGGMTHMAAAEFKAGMTALHTTLSQVPWRRRHQTSKTAPARETASSGDGGGGGGGVVHRPLGTADSSLSQYTVLPPRPGLAPPPRSPSPSLDPHSPTSIKAALWSVGLATTAGEVWELELKLAARQKTRRSRTSPSPERGGAGGGRAVSPSKESARLLVERERSSERMKDLQRQAEREREKELELATGTAERLGQLERLQAEREADAAVRRDRREAEVPFLTPFLTPFSAHFQPIFSPFSP